MAYRDKETSGEAFLALVVGADDSSGPALTFVDRNWGYRLEGWWPLMEDTHLPAAFQGEEALGSGWPR